MGFSSCSRTLLGALLALAALACESGRNAEVAVGTLERDRIELVAEVAEPIVAIHVREGDEVVTGELLAELDPARSRARVDAAAAARDRAQAALEEMLRGTREEEILEAEALVAEVEAEIVEAGLDLRRANELLAGGVEPRARVDEAQRRQDAALARREAARATLERLLNGATAEELGQARAVVAESEAVLMERRLDRERLRLTAPRSGRVDALPFEVGERPPAGGVVIVLLAGDAPYARVYVPSALRPRVEPGTPAVVLVEGVAETFSARVRIVSSEASFTPYFALTEQDRGRLSYVAEVELLGEPGKNLPTGLPVEARFETGPTPSGDG